MAGPPQPGGAGLVDLLLNITQAAVDSNMGSLHVLPNSTFNARQTMSGTNLNPHVNQGWQPTPPLVGSQLEQSVVPVEIWKSFQVVHTTMTVLALIGNCVSLGVIYGLVSRLTPPLQLLTSLAFAEMLAPWAIMTMYFPASSCQDEIHSALLLTAHNAGAITLIGQ